MVQAELDLIAAVDLRRLGAVVVRAPPEVDDRVDEERGDAPTKMTPVTAITSIDNSKISDAGVEAGEKDGRRAHGMTPNSSRAVCAMRIPGHRSTHVRSITRCSSDRGGRAVCGHTPAVCERAMAIDVTFPRLSLPRLPFGGGFASSPRYGEDTARCCHRGGRVRWSLRGEGACAAPP